MHLNDLLTHAVRSGASDIHIKVGSYPMMRVDGTLLVVEADRVDAQQAQQAKRELVNFGAMPLGVVFNKQRRRAFSWLGRR